MKKTLVVVGPQALHPDTAAKEKLSSALVGLQATVHNKPTGKCEQQAQPRIHGRLGTFQPPSPPTNVLDLLLLAKSCACATPCPAYLLPLVRGRCMNAWE